MEINSDGFIILEQHYVVGFLFDMDFDKVVLIHKNKGPKSVKGNWNGLGGKIEESESSYEAMVREFKEESGMRITDWIYSLEYKGPGYVFDVFYAKTSHIDSVRTNEDEEVAIYFVDDLPTALVSNLRWMIPLIMDHSIEKPIYINDRN